MKTEIDIQTIKNNLIIWRALNIVDSQSYPYPINDGQGLAHETGNHAIIKDFYFTYFHNNWNDLIPALLLLTGNRFLLTSFENAYQSLLGCAKEIIVGLPDLIYFLEDGQQKWIIKDYYISYDPVSAVETDAIPMTNDPMKALSFETKVEANLFKNSKFQARHIEKIKITEHEFPNPNPK